MLKYKIYKEYRLTFNERSKLSAMDCKSVPKSQTYNLQLNRVLRY